MYVVCCSCIRFVASAHVFSKQPLSDPVLLLLLLLQLWHPRSHWCSQPLQLPHWRSQPLLQGYISHIVAVARKSARLKQKRRRRRLRLSRRQKLSRKVANIWTTPALVQININRGSDATLVALSLRLHVNRL